MNRPSNFEQTMLSREVLTKLGEPASHKSCYPELQRRIDELERFQLLLDQALDAIFLLDAKTSEIIYANAVAGEYCGCPVAELIGSTLAPRLRMPGFDFAAQPQAESAYFRSDACLLTRQDGVSIPLEVSINRVELQENQFLVIVARDITKRLQLYERHLQVHEDFHASYGNLESIYGQLSGAEESVSRQMQELTRQKEQFLHIAFQDALTGLPNRYSLNSALAAISRQSSVSGGLLLLNIDNFKFINDSWGHTVGDMLLHEVARRLCGLQTEGMQVYRLGGDEFVLLLDNLSTETAASWAKQVLALFERPIAYRQTQVALTASIGVTLFSEEMTPDDVLRQADIALHAAKNAGKRVWRLYQPEMQKPVLERIRLEQELRQALKEEQFVLFFQPQYSLDGLPVAMEALLRWQHPTTGLTLPLTFIAVAEETGLIVELGEWVLRQACQFGRLYTERNGAMRIAVNVSARQLMQDDFTQRVLQIIETEQFPAELLELELTETVLMESFEANVKKLAELRSRGIRISLDDFGTGYSSLTYLSRLPIDTLKIDKSFLYHPDKNGFSAILGIIVQLAHELNLAVVAEGVETAEQLAILRRLGCDYLQGYLANPPLPPEVAQRIRYTVHPAFR